MESNCWKGVESKTFIGAAPEQDNWEYNVHLFKGQNKLHICLSFIVLLLGINAVSFLSLTIILTLNSNTLTKHL